MNKIRGFLKKYTSKQAIQITSIIFVVLLSIAAIVTPFLLNRQKNLSMQSSKASEPTIPPSCDVRFTIRQITPTLTSTPTPTITPTPTLNCKNLDISIVVDRSGTMDMPEDGISGHKKKLEYAKEAMSAFVNTVISSNTTSARINVNSFGRQGNMNDPVLGNLTLGPTYNSTIDAPLTNQLSTIVLPAITNMVHIEDGTCIQCGLNLGYKQLTNSVNSSRKVMILLSDGMANKIWTGVNPGSTVSKQSAVDQANNGRSANIEYRVIGYGMDEEIDEATLKRIACANPDDLTCVNNNYTYKPNAVDWSNAFLTILNELCQ